MAPVTAQELKFGQMAPNTRASGASTKRTARVNSGMPMEMSMKVSGKTIRQMATAFTYMSTVLSMRATGEMISKMALASSPGPMGPSTRAAIKRE